MSNNEEYWPDRILAQKTITYDVRRIREELQQYYDSSVEPGETPKEVEFDEVLNLIYEYVSDDFSCSWGHKSDTADVIVFDPDGDEY